MDGYEASQVTVEVDGEAISVKIDPYYGPQPYRVGGHPPGPNDSIELPMDATENGLGNTHKKWADFTATERKLAVYQTARISKMRQEHAAAVPGPLHNRCVKVHFIWYTIKTPCISLIEK